MQPFHERLSPPLSWWLGAAIFSVACGWVIFVAATLFAGLVTAVVVAGATLTSIVAYGRTQVIVEAEAFIAGSAQLPLRFAGQVWVLDPTQWRHFMGPGSDARAFILSRPYLPVGVMVEITDPRDPAPYWLVSSRRPEDLALALSEQIRQDGTQTNDRKEPGGEGNDEGEQKT